MNNNVNPRILKMQDEAERAFRNISGSEKFRNYDGFVAGGGRDEFAGMTGQNYMSVDGSNRHTPKTIAVDIQNTDELSELSAPLFSVNEGFIAPFGGVGSLPGTSADFITKNTAAAGKGIVITFQDYGTNEIKELARTTPFLIAGYRYDFGDEIQLKQRWVLRRKDGAFEGQEAHRPSEYRSLANQIQSTLDNGEFKYKVDGKGTLFLVMGKAISATQPRKVQIIFRVGAEANLSAALVNRQVVMAQ